MIEPMFTILPERRGIMWRAAARHAKNMPLTFVSMIQSQVFSSTSSDGPVRFTPALLTSTSGGPSVVTVRSTSASICATLCTSVGTASVGRPNFAASAAVASSVSAWRPASATEAPAAAKASAVRRPMPLPAPVTMTTWPAKSKEMFVARNRDAPGGVTGHGNQPIACWTAGDDPASLPSAEAK